MHALLTHLILIIPHFLIDVSIATLAILAISGASLLLPQIRHTVYRFAFPYLSVASFILVTEIVLRLFPHPMFIVKLITFLFITMSIGGYLLVGKRVLAGLRKPNLFLISVISITVLCTFFLFNLTYQNGLHDEYYHHANIKLFFETPTYPFLEPYRIGSTITGYHVGLYFPVIALKAFTNLSVEQSLDIIKLSLFLPAPFVLSKLLAKYFAVSDFTSVLCAGMGFVLGPSLFLLDSFSDNVLRGFSNPQLHTPILFEYAGLTWHGLTFFLTFTLLFHLSLRDQTDFLQNLLKRTATSLLAFRSIVILSVFSMLSLWLINRAFCLAFIIVGAVTGIFYLIRLLSKKHQRNLFSLLVIVTSALLLASATGKDVPLFRHPNSWGVVYLDLSIDESATSRFRYATITQLTFWKYLGLLGVLSIVLGVIRRRFLDSWQFSLLVLFPLWVYFWRTPGAHADDLAFTKLLRPLFFMIPVCVYAYSKDWKPIPRAILTALLFLGCVSPLYFFMTSDFSGVQQDWVISDPALKDIVEHLPSHLNPVGIQANTQGLQHVLANVVHAQVEVCYTACGAQPSVRYVIENKEKPMQVSSMRKIIFENSSYRLYR